MRQQLPVSDRGRYRYEWTGCPSMTKSWGWSWL